MSYAGVAGHSATILRRAGNRFVTIDASRQVLPDEVVRLMATGVQNALINSPDFVVTDGAGNVLLRQEVGVTLAGEAWIDTRAPKVEGEYLLTVHAQSFPGPVPATHPYEFRFWVDAAALPPPKPPPSGVFGDIRTLGFIALGLVGLMLARDLARRVA